MLVLAGNWWTFVLRGVLAVLFGILTFVWPGLALLSLVFLFGFYAITDGVLSIIAAFRHRRGDVATAAALAPAAADANTPWWAMLIIGILGILAGLGALFMPGISALALLFVICAWAVATGVMSIVAAVRLRKVIEGEWLLALSGVLSIAFGVLAAIFPGAGALAIVLWIGAYAIVYGIMLTVLGFRLRSWMRHTPGEHPGHGFARVAHN